MRGSQLEADKTFGDSFLKCLSIVCENLTANSQLASDEGSTLPSNILKVKEVFFTYFMTFCLNFFIKKFFKLKNKFIFIF